MRALSWWIWLVAAAALALTALVGIGAVRLLGRAPVPSQLALVTPDEPRLILSTPDRVLVATRTAAWRVDPWLAVHPLALPRELHLVEVQSVAVSGARIALTAKANFGDGDHNFPAVLVIDGARTALIYHPGSDVHHAQVSNVRAVGPENDEPPGTCFAVYIHEDERLYRLPFCAAHDGVWDENRHQLESGFWPTLVERIWWPADAGPLFVQRRGDEIVTVDVFGYWRATPPEPRPANGPVRLVLAGTELTAPPPPPPVEIGHYRVRSAGRTLASLRQPETFWAAPLGNATLLFGEIRPLALLLDAGGARIDQVGRVATLRALADDPSAAWLGLAAALALAALALPIVMVRAARGAARAHAAPADEVAPGARGVFFGRLRIPEGALLETDLRGHVQVTGGCAVALGGGQALELAAGLRRSDARTGVPLIDGDAVFVIGCVEGDRAEGPWRSSGRLRLGPDGAQHAIGRGGAGDYADTLRSRYDRRALQAALAVAVAAVALLARFGFAAFQ